MATRTLLLLRHAQTEAARPGHRDESRRLTAQGTEQARRLGDYLRAEQRPVAHVLCSTAERARQTLGGLGLGQDVDADVTPRLYNAGADEIVDLIRALPAEAAVALVVGHAPAIGSVASELADPQTSDPTAVQTLESRFPAGALAVLDVDGDWSDLRAVRLVDVRLP